MRKKLLCAFVLCAVCIMTALGASAADISSNLAAVCDSTRTTGNITVTGKTGTNFEELVFVVITGQSMTTDTMTADDFSDAYTIGQCVSDEAGNFTIVLNLAEKRSDGTPNLDGQYDCIAITAGGNKGSKTFQYYSPHQIRSALKILSNREISVADFQSTFGANKDLFYTNTAKYDSDAFADKRDRAIQTIIDSHDGNFDDVAEFNKMFDLATYLVELDDITDAEAVMQYLKGSGAKAALGIDPRYYEAKDSVKLKVCGFIADANLTTSSVLYNTVNTNLVVEEFKAVTVWNNLEGLITKYSDVIFLDPTADADYIEKLGKLENKNDAYQKMDVYKNEYTSIAGIISAYKKGISDAYDDNGGGGDGLGGPGGPGVGDGDDGSSQDDLGSVLPMIPEQTVPTTERFSDLAGYGWAKNAIYDLADEGVISGYPDGRFGPGELLTREQVVVMLINAYQKATPGDVSGFADVKDGAWYAKYVSYAVGSGIAAGMGDGNFGIGLPITRQDFALMAYNAMGANYSPKGTASMNDLDSVSGYARTAVEALVEMGVLSGDENRNVRPKDYTTRAEAAVILSKIRG